MNEEIKDNKVEGINWHKNKINEFCVIRLHYSANPNKRTDRWKKDAHRGMTENSWNKEYEITFTSFGSGAVFKEYDNNKHCINMPVYPNLPIIRGWDFGYHHPAVVFTQKTELGCLNIGDLVLGRDIGIKQFGRYIKEYCEKYYKGYTFQDYGDPAGAQVRDVAAGKSAIHMLKEFDINVRFRKSSVREGIELLRNLLLERTDKNFGMYISDNNNCQFIRELFEGGYRWDEKVEAPLKDGFYDHIADALRYIVVNCFRHYLKIEEPKEKEYTNRPTSVTGY